MFIALTHCASGMFAHVIWGVLFNDGRGVLVGKQHVTALFTEWVQQRTAAACVKGGFQVKRTVKVDYYEY